MVSTLVAASMACTTARVTQSAAAPSRAWKPTGLRRRPHGGGQREHRVAVEHRVHRVDRASQPVVTDAGNLLALGLRQGEVGAEHNQGRGERRSGLGSRCGGGESGRQVVRRRSPHGRDLAGQQVPRTQQLAGAEVDRRAHRIDDDQRADRGAVRQHLAGRAHPALQAARHRTGSRTDTASQGAAAPPGPAASS